MGKEIIFSDEAFSAEAGMSPEAKTEFHRLVQILEENGFLLAPFAEKGAGEVNLFAIRVRKGGNFREFYAYDDGVSI